MEPNSELENNECEAKSCSDIATTPLKINTDGIGSITIRLCNNCAVKFQLKKTDNDSSNDDYT